tara:strand:- start:144 stop:374 length:231 start_codon:yes stop_codon:yes gene_type:complete
MSNRKENIALIRIGDDLIRFSDISRCIRQYKSIGHWKITCYRNGKEDVEKTFYGDSANSDSHKYMEEIVQLSRDNN